MRRSTRPRISKRSAASLSRAAGASSKLASPSSERLPLPPRAVNFSIRALLPCKAMATLPSLTFTPCRKLRTPRWAPSMRPVYSGAPKRPPIDALACISPVRRQPAGTHRPQVPRLATRTSSTPSTGVLASGQAAVGEVRAVTAPEATPRLSPARAAVSLQTPSSAAMPRRRSVRPSFWVPYSSVTSRSPLARSTTASTRTEGAPCASSRPWRARSPPQPKSGWMARSSGAIGSGSMVADASRRAPPPRPSPACQAALLQRIVAPSASALPGSRLARCGPPLQK